MNDQMIDEHSSEQVRFDDMRLRMTTMGARVMEGQDKILGLIRFDQCFQRDLRMIKHDCFWNKLNHVLLRGWTVAEV